MGRRSVVESTDSDESDYDQYYMPMYDSESVEQSVDDSEDSDEDSDDSESCYDSDEEEEDDDDDDDSESCYDSDEDDDSDEESSYDSCEIEEVIALTRMKRTKKQSGRTSKLSKKSKSCATRSKPGAKKDVIRQALKKKISKKSTRSLTSQGNTSSCRKKPATTRSKKGKEKAKAGMRVVSSNKKKDLGNRPVTFLVFDLETTGLHRIYHRIIEIALVDINGGERSTFYSLVNPGCPVTNSHIHGITSNMVTRPGVPRMQGMIPKLLQFVKSREKAGGYVVLVAHNARRFDVPFLENEFKRCSTPIPSNWLFLDTLPLARQAMKSTG
ncbi:hypothetical protein Cgig2_015166 [Carnegiea gigantea]|uniref:Exonuclease domain-containing protein n=1 Tax=Carnegiea gigantea TaxID=171969 RepID=A0A9Q1KQP9_9CARY|nr:hypothetical protein Cgig2_015166 [Carnegiea gigantea]